MSRKNGTEKKGVDSDTGERDNTRDKHPASTLSLSDQDKGDIISGIAGILQPQLNKYIDSAIDKKFKELHPPSEQAVSTPNAQRQSPGASAGSGAPGASSDELKPLDINQLISDFTKQGTPQNNALQGVLGQAQGQMGQLQVILELLKTLGGTGQQANPMGAYFMELQYREMIRKTAFSDYLERMIIKNFASRMGDPASYEEFAKMSDSLVMNPLKNAVASVSAPAGAQGAQQQ